MQPTNSPRTTCDDRSCSRRGTTTSSSYSTALHDDVFVSSAAGTALSSWPELKQLTTAVTVTPFESDAQQQQQQLQRHRKRQRPSAPPSPSSAFPDLKLDFAGFELGSSVPTPTNLTSSSGPLSSLFASTPTTRSSSCSTTSSTAIGSAARPTAALPDSGAANGYNIADAYDVATAHDTDVLLFLQNLQLPQDSAAAARRLAQDGFDSVLALAFATVPELQRAGLTDAPVVWRQARRSFYARQFQGPMDLSSASSSTVSKWLELCGIPRAPSFKYAEYLCRLGYASVRDLEFIGHDHQALAGFKTGHSRLLTHCIAAAVALQQQQQQQQQLHHHEQHQQQQQLQLESYGGHGPNVYTAGSSSAFLQPLDIQRDNEFDVQAYDSFLDALIEPTDAERLQLQQQQQQQQQQRYAVSGLSREADGSGNHLLSSPSDALFGTGAGVTFGDRVSPAAGSNAPLRLLPQEHLQLLYEAVNMARPNPCRRGKKIYWSVLASGGMKDDRFAPLTQFTGTELQHAYLRQFELPANSPVKMDAWSEDNIRQLEYAVKDPRCRHLSKVCWEMLATGRTGVDEYAPLAKFTASQLRSRFRSLFGDKRPQKLRQKKQMMKLQQQHQQQSPTSGTAVKSERLL
ncbi:unnamed protein product [Hyaloperonospora brassicae]|uniref:Myb-like domain-containing protein n=1 Tax=Hyaloperonospora brassicae TaxID=162125 RepID=A0AAV0UF91_HYABA|nr:unnamed protein product [Hyaloperonospora brassicae]